MYKRLLLAFDGSEYSLRATEEAIKIASLSEDCRVDIVYVAEFSKAKNEALHFGGREELAIERQKRLLPATEKLTSRQIAHDVHILHGEPGPAIVDFANKGNFDMLIIGSRGLNKFQEMVLGSVSHKVAKRVDCPVLIIK